MIICNWHREKIKAVTGSRVKNHRPLCIDFILLVNLKIIKLWPDFNLLFSVDVNWFV